MFISMENFPISKYDRFPNWKGTKGKYELSGW